MLKNDFIIYDSNLLLNDIIILKVLLFLDYCKYKNVNYCLKSYF